MKAFITAELIGPKTLMEIMFNSGPDYRALVELLPGMLGNGESSTLTDDECRNKLFTLLVVIPTLARYSFEKDTTISCFSRADLYFRRVKNDSSGDTKVLDRVICSMRVLPMPNTTFSKEDISEIVDEISEAFVPAEPGQERVSDIYFFVTDNRGRARIGTFTSIKPASLENLSFLGQFEKRAGKLQFLHMETRQKLDFSNYLRNRP